MQRPADATSAETIAAVAISQGTGSKSAGGAEEGRFLPGTLLGGRYRIIGLLGRGGMGEVYRATDLMLGQSVALKLLPESAATNGFLLERFHSEVRVARQVSHPNVCRVYDMGEAEGLPFISMEYVDGEDLSSLLHRIGRVPFDKALTAARQICAGLAAAHARGVIHRDLKPQNIMMDKHGQIMIMDFGLAAISDQISGLEARHGTPAYMSPEQLKGGDVTAKSDIYALGLVLYELFTGKRPFEADNIQRLIERQESVQFASMSSLAAEIDPAVEKVIRRCLAPDANKRPATPLAVSVALPGGDPLAAALAAGETPSPEMVASAGKTEGLARKYSLPCLGVVIACVIATPLLKQQSVALMRAPAGFPPEVLRQKSRDVAAAFGYPDKPADAALWLNQRLELLQYLSKLPSPRKWDDWLAAESPITAAYRESLEPMVAAPSGDISRDNPAPVAPGMVEVDLDGSGQLRYFAAVPYPAVHAPPAQAIPAEAVFHAAQLEFTRFATVTPTTLPPSASDDFRAWRGPHPKLPNTAMTVEIAWWKGRVTYARFLSPWAAGRGPGVPEHPFLARVREILDLILTVAGFIFSALLARRNWKVGRGDRRGALVVATFMFAVGLTNWLGYVHAVPTVDMVELFSNGAATALLNASLVWLLYLALEPALRSRWPHSIVTWNRLLAGRWRDAQLAGHVLIGAALGCTLLKTTEAVDAWGARDQALSTAAGLAMLNGTRMWMAGLANRAGVGVRIGLLIFFVIFGLRTILRRDWIAAIVGALIFAALEGEVANAANPPLAYSIFAMLFLILMTALMRLGLVVAISAVFFFNVLNGVTLGTDFTAWYTPTGVATAAVVVAITLAAFQRSLGNTDLFSGEEPER
jgi:Protein kinase domain